MKSKLYVSVFISWSISGLAVASEEGFALCRRITDSNMRLDCYDAVPISVSESSKAVHQDSSSGTESTVDRRSVAIGPLTGEGTMSASGQAFGLRSPVAREMESLESKVSGKFDGWLAGGQIRLANGQVWQVTDGSEAAYDLPNPKVTITHGMLGSYFMRIEGVSQTPRVRRIE